MAQFGSSQAIDSPLVFWAWLPAITVDQVDDPGQSGLPGLLSPHLGMRNAGLSCEHITVTPVYLARPCQVPCVQSPQFLSPLTIWRPQPSPDCQSYRREITHIYIAENHRKT